MLTDQDKAEIRQMIIQELNARGIGNQAVAFTVGGTVAAATPFFQPNPNPQKVLYPNGGEPITVTISPASPDIPTVSPDY